jgi:hypothetical protein
MPTHIRVAIGKHRERERHERDDDNTRPGWAKSREKLGDEPPIKSLSVGIARWLDRASKNSYASNPSVAPGIGVVRKSSQ